MAAIPSSSSSSLDLLSQSQSQSRASALSSNSNSLSTDVRSLASLKTQAGADPKGSVREAAKAFESMFMQQIMKNMRESTMPTGLLDNEGTKLGNELLDSQMSTQMSGLPGGLADVLTRQLERQMGVPSSGTMPKSALAASALRAGSTDTAAQQKAVGSAQGFVAQHQTAAHEVEAQTGIPAGFLIAQAAHETGWGKHDIKNADGTSSNNLFAIKAGATWKGKVAEVTTTEYVNGAAQKVKQKFRAYDTAEDSFSDYAKMMKGNPRYEHVIASAGNAQGFAQGLQRAGYATDPAYAAKLTKVINTTLRLQRSIG